MYVTIQLKDRLIIILEYVKRGITFAVTGQLDTGGSGLSSPAFRPCSSAELESSPQ
jgi:hypothetical protein